MAGNVTAGSDLQLSGRQLARRYTLSDELPAGALSRIVRGDDLMLRRPVIVKAIPPEQIEIYQAAMRASSALTHPAAIAFYDAFYEDGWLLLVQEAVQGQALSRYLRQGVPSERTVNLALQLAQALAYAHHRDIVHGDLTPTAVLVDRRATVRVNNFGLPPDLDYLLREGGEEMLPLLTECTPYSDVLALGLLLRQMLSNAELAAADNGSRQLRPDVPLELTQLVTRCVTPDASDAIRDAATLASALEEMSEHLAQTRQSASTDTPAALRVAHAVAADQARWSSEETLAGMQVPSHSLERESHEVGSRFTMITDPGQLDGAATRAASETDLALAPRLRLPARPWPEPPSFHEAARAAAPIYHDNADENNDRARSVGLGAVLLVSAALFVIFFLIGYLGPFTLGGH